jgi:tyrosyl-tRNA synthetase
MGNVLDTLKERGFVYLVSDEAGLRAALEQPVVAYCGYDPTDSSLTHGNLVTIMMLAHLQRAGHRPIALVGGGTGMVGDPSDKSAARPILSIEELDANAANIRGQLSRFLEFGDGRAEMVDNAEWLRSVRYLDFLRDVGKHFSINVMLDLEFVRSRLAGQGGLTYLEFSYILLQAYDFLELYRRYGCTLQVGGSDQWANILAGADLIRRVDGGKAFGLVAPLVTASSGRKVSKSEGTAVYLDPTRTSPYEFYQFWVNTEDADVERYLAIYTFLPIDKVRALGRLAGADLREAKEVLAWEVTAVVHGEQAANEARETSLALFRGEAGGSDAAPATEVSEAELGDGLTLVDVLPRTGLASSKRDARRLIDGRGVRLNGDVVLSPERILTDADFANGEALLRKGKTFHRLVVARTA